MRTTLDLPDSLLRQLKARAALEGTTLKTLVRSLIERGLQVPAAQPFASPEAAPALPSIRLSRALNLPRPSNSALFELLDE